MFRKRKKKRQKRHHSDFAPDCAHSPTYDELVEHEIDGVKVMAFQCQMCNTFGRRPTAFILEDENMRIPDFDTLKGDSEIELYYKLNWLSHVIPNKETQALVAVTKHELKTRFGALKYDNPKEGTRRHYLACQKAMRKVLKEVSESGEGTR